MSAPSFASRWNLGAIETLYEQWRENSESVDPQWRIFFEGFELGSGQQPQPSSLSSSPPPQSDFGNDARQQLGVFRLVQAYRDLGHFLAHLDPLSQRKVSYSLLHLSEFGLTDQDLDRQVVSAFAGLPSCTLMELIQALWETYCGTIGVEYMHIQDTHIRRWLQERMEPRRNKPNLSHRQKYRVLMDLQLAEMFEKFLHTKFLGQKRFSLEGGETLIPILEALVENAADCGVREIVMGMAHRGRLNVLANVLGKPYEEIFTEFDDQFLPHSIDGDGDVKYHLGFSADRETPHGHNIHISLTPNPSHLEAVNPVVEGRMRAKQTLQNDVDRTHGLPLLIHGDAAFAGQGLVAETLNLSQLRGYRTGGTIHIIVNNQIGFTTAPIDARSTYYCTDVAKMIQVPIFHVNGEDPEAAVYVAELAVEFRQKFHTDVVIDMYCYRRRGHNEGDDPAFTQPLMYSQIKDRPTLSETYTEQLVLRGDLTVGEVESINEEFRQKLQHALEEVQTTPRKSLGMQGYRGRWEGLGRSYDPTPVDTTVSQSTLETIAEGLVRVPESFTIQTKIAKQLEQRQKRFQQGAGVDWAFAELLAFGSLLLEGTPIRLSGQDSRRGTFSQRHSVLYDAVTGDDYIPLNSLSGDQAFLNIFDSLLSEAAVLGFEFGYSMDLPNELVLWEAQFGDFANGAQVIIDQFLVCSASKWQRDSGLVLLLPHGYEGQGPEHSSARLERFLQLCGEANIQVCNLTTPAQYFHVLRRQMLRNFRKPLILMTPKSLLRHKKAVSEIEEFTNGQFEEVLDDPNYIGTEDADQVQRVLFCSGKIYYDLLAELDHHDSTDHIAIIRLEQFYPFPYDRLRDIIAKYHAAEDWIWVQEESANMGGWFFVEPKFRHINCHVKYIGRDTSASPATGSKKIHEREQKELVEAAIILVPPHYVRAQSALTASKPEANGPITKN